MIHLYELIKVDRKHLKGDHEMFSENELIPSSNNVLFILWIFIVQMLDKSGFYKTLLIQPLLILENLESNVLSLFMVVTLEHHSEAAFANLLRDFISVS